VDQDHIGWKSRKLIARTGQLAEPLRSSEPKGHPPTPRGTRGNFGESRGGRKKWRSGAQKRQYLWNAYR